MSTVVQLLWKVHEEIISQGIKLGHRSVRNVSQCNSTDQWRRARIARLEKAFAL